MYPSTKQTETKNMNNAEYTEQKTSTILAATSVKELFKIRDDIAQDFKDGKITIALTDALMQGAREEMDKFNDGCEIVCSVPSPTVIHG